jgi:hypothetical protein
MKQFTTSYSPTTTVFASMAKEDLDHFYQWFMTNLPYCIEELMQLVRSTPGFESWNPDYSPCSLDSLGEWFTAKAKRRDLTQDEVDAVKKRTISPVEIPSWDLTEETKSLSVYVGMYYGEVALQNNPALKWEQPLENKKMADFGQPVVAGPGVVPINPVRVANAFACGLVSGTKVGGNLRKAYDYWTKLVMPE